MDKSIFNSFGLRENPFSVNPDPRHLFLTRQTQTTLDALIQGVQSRQGLVLLTGDVGTGKTTLINSLLEWLQQNGIPTAFIFNSHLEARELFELMLADFHIASDVRSTSSAVSHLHAWLLERYRAGETAVLIVDEAQGLPSHTIEEIRLLLNLETPNGKLLQIVLSGQSEFNDRLKRLDLRPLHQRISLRCRTSPMTLEETHGCIQHRLRVAGAQDDALFTLEAMDSAHFYSRGIPRIINLLCEQALLKAYYSGIRPVSASMIEDASREFQFDGDRPIPPPKADETIGLRANLIPMQSMSSRPTMTFAAAAGLSSEGRQDPKPVRVPAPPAKGELVRHPKAFADVDQIIAELSAGAKASAPVVIHPAGAKSSSSLATVSNRVSISSLARAKAILLASVAKSSAEFGRQTHDGLISLRSYSRRWSNQFLAMASPVLKRITTPFISWLKEPRPPTLLARANSKTHVEPPTRFSAVSNNLRDRAEPIVRWLQTPLRPAHRR
jgi:type II secretory pathway predicted ATPase ExeA